MFGGSRGVHTPGPRGGEQGRGGRAGGRDQGGRGEGGGELFFFFPQAARKTGWRGGKQGAQQSFVFVLFVWKNQKRPDSPCFCFGGTGGPGGPAKKQTTLHLFFFPRLQGVWGGGAGGGGDNPRKAGSPPLPWDLCC